MNTPESVDEQLVRSLLRLNGTMVGVAFGLACGLALFFATIFLVIKGGPNVGAHLRLLNQFFPGYTVTVAGSFIGLIYGCVTGFVAGWLVGWIYNRVALMRAPDR